jgi:hypothetical protein
MTAKFFFQTSKSQDPIDQDACIARCCSAKFSGLKLRAWNAHSSSSFNLNAMTSVSAIMLPERAQAVRLKAMHSLKAGSLQNRASKRFSF